MFMYPGEMKTYSLQKIIVSTEMFIEALFK